MFKWVALTWHWNGCMQNTHWWKDRLIRKCPNDRCGDNLFKCLFIIGPYPNLVYHIVLMENWGPLHNINTLQLRCGINCEAQARVRQGLARDGPLQYILIGDPAWLNGVSRCWLAYYYFGHFGGLPCRGKIGDYLHTYSHSFFISPFFDLGNVLFSHQSRHCLHCPVMCQILGNSWQGVEHFADFDSWSPYLVQLW